MLVPSVRLLIAALWAGSLWTIGYLVAPVLFATLDDRALAGTIAGRLFHIEAWLSVACALALLALHRMRSDGSDPRRARIRLLLTVAMLVCALIGYFGLYPSMTALRASAGPGGVMASAARTQFGLLHGISSTLYLLESLLAAALVVLHSRYR